MRMISLQSGSNGNCVYVEALGVRLLIDAGISGIQAEQRLAAHGIDIRQVDALLISHDHSDHVRCMGVYQRKYGVPIHATNRTLLAAHARNRLGTLDDVRPFQAGRSLEINGVRIETIPTAHDSADGVGFVVDDGECRAGVLTDLGHVFQGLEDVLQSLDAVLLESNYDPDMLADGPYPPLLQDRIRGPGGHLSNWEAAELLGNTCRAGRLRWACLGHLSEQNNQPTLALAAHRHVLDDDVPLYVASRERVGPVLEVTSQTDAAVSDRC